MPSRRAARFFGGESDFSADARFFFAGFRPADFRAEADLVTDFLAARRGMMDSGRFEEVTQEPIKSRFLGQSAEKRYLVPFRGGRKVNTPVSGKLARRTPPLCPAVGTNRYACDPCQTLSRRSYLTDPMSRTLCLLTLAVATFLGTARTSADIVVDYSNDSNNFFVNNPTAQAALEAAVSDLNNVLNLALGSITSDTTVGNSGGGTELTWNFDYRYTNPSTGATETVADSRLPDNEIRVFVGARNLGGSTLGQGGPTGVRWQISGMIGSGSVADAVTAAQAVHQHGRLDGPVITTVSGSVAGANYSFDLGPTLGNLWFDQDTDNNGVADNTSTLEQNWHFDHTTPVAAGKSDFYSVALHEILHSIGIGTADSWDALVDGTNWLGSEVIALNGTGAGLIDAGSGHFAEGVMSTRLSDGMAQEVVMDPSITVGTRKELTALDLAMLRDIGYANAIVTAIPEPSGLAALLVVFAGASVRRRRCA